MIPKVIYQIGSGPFLRKLHQLNPEFSVQVLTDANCTSFIARHGDRGEWVAYSSLRPGAPRADLCRMALLKYRGGFYIETDVEMLAPLRTLPVNTSTFITGYHWPFEFIGSVANHSIIRRVLQVQVTNIMREVKNIGTSLACRSSHSCVIRVTGPLAYSSAVGDVTHARGCTNRHRLPHGRDCRHAKDKELRDMHVCAMNRSNPYRTYSCGVARHWDCRNSGSQRRCGREKAPR